MIKTFLIFMRDFAIACAIVFLLNTFIVQGLRVDGNSMIPTISDDDIVLINKLAYTISEPKKDDIIGFYTKALDQQLVKRIVGVSGDEIDFKDNALYYNGVPFIEGNDYELIKKGNMVYPVKVPKDHYFVLGDNYNESTDSRYIEVGVIPKEAIMGQVSMRLWPIRNDNILK